MICIMEERLWKILARPNFKKYEYTKHRNLREVSQPVSERVCQQSSNQKSWEEDQET